MAKFPLREANILKLASVLASGLKKNPQVYLNTPVSPQILEETTAQLNDCRNQVVSTLAKYKQALEQKDAKLAELVDMMKKNIRYAENATDFNDDKLKLLGWSGRKKRGKLLPPGQCMGLKVRYNSGGLVILDWKKPEYGGTVRFYEVQRRVKNGASWELAASSATETATLKDQPTAVKIEYTVAAVNKKGKGPQSTTVETMTT